MEESLTIEPLQSFNGPEITSIGRSSVLHAGSYGSHLKIAMTSLVPVLGISCAQQLALDTRWIKVAKRKANALGSSIAEGFK